MALVFLGTALGLMAIVAALSLGQPLWLGLLALSGMGSGSVLVFAAMACGQPRRGAPATVGHRFPAPGGF